MIELVRLYWRIHRLKVAIICAALILGTNLLLPLSDSEPYVFTDSLLQAVASIGFYLIMTPIFMIVYYIYNKQKKYRNRGYTTEIPEIFTVDNFLCVFTVYSTFGFIAGFIFKNLLLG
ncbi:hypothetical protein [Geofilum rhodophaeum]|uniref:hypothetical protein n=1 Tax=Geofilum rhodophaeum TaxID=1965019 RepID=UPI000B51E7FB|nr:hypothetical protein [Geofilum rhodophaeum]